MSYSDLTLEGIPKLKVPELKKELKARDLPTTGNKSDLVARLELALSDTADEVVDEEALLGAEEDSVLEEEPPAVPETVPVQSQKLKTVAKVPPKKVVGNAPKTTESIGTETEADKIAKRQERFGVTSDNAAKALRAQRFGIINDEEKKKARAEKFGIETSETKKTSSEAIDEKKQKRAARFGITDETNKPTTKKGSNIELTEEERQKMLKRKERFGESVSEKIVAVEVDEKKQKRAARFGAITKSVSTDDEERKKKRAAKFGI